MTKTKSKTANGNQLCSPYSQEAASGNGSNANSCDDGDTSEEPNGGETITVQILCTPYGSKLKKPTDFLKSAFTEFTKSQSNKVRIKSVSYLKDDIFLVEIYKKCLNVIKELAGRADLEYAMKKIKIISIPVTESSCCSPSKRKMSEVNPKTDGRVVEILGDTDGLGNSCQKYFERNGGLQLYDIETVDMSSKPQTITFGSAQGARSFVQRSLNIDGKAVYFRLCSDKHNDSASDVKNITGRTVVLLGNTKSIDKSILEVYLQSKKRSGGGGFERIDMDIDPPVVIFHDAQDAEGVINKHLHTIDGNRFYAIHPTQMEDNMEESDQPISNVDNGKIVEIHGDITGLSKDALILYLESKKRSGGGEIEKVSWEATPPLVIFCDVEAARGVVENNVHTFQGKEFRLKFPVQKNGRKGEDNKSSTASKADPVNIVEIHGAVRGLGKEALELYFENTKRSGGGEIENFDWDATPPRITFKDAEAARRVVEKSMHKFEKTEFFLKFPGQQSEREKEYGRPSSTSNVKPVNIVEIHGAIRGLGKEALELYFENTERSGGGEIEDFDWDATPPRVTFKDAEVARRVVENAVHEFAGKKFILTFPVQKKNNSVGEGNQSSGTLDAEPANIVEIHGDIKGLGEETLVMYLENTGRSGGGHIEELNLDATPPRITFRHAEDAARAISKKSHTLDGITFQLKKPKVTLLRDNTIMLCNLNPSSSEELLSMYLERLCGSPPHNVEVNHDRSMAMASFSFKIDWNRIRAEHSRRSTLEGAKIAVKPVPVCNSAFISNIPNSVSTDYLLLAIEKNCGSDSVEDWDYEKGREHAVITFHSPKALLALTKRKIEFKGKAADIEEYYPSFISERTWKIMHREPAEICINVDGLIMEHMMNKHKMDACQRLKSKVYTKNVKSSEGHNTTQVCFSRSADVPNQREIFLSFYNEFIRKKVSADLNNQGVRDLADSLNVTIYPKPDGALAVVGRKEDVEKFLENANKSSHIHTDLELPSEKIRLLESTGRLKHLAQELRVQIKADQNKLKVTGSELQVARFESKLNLMLQNIKSASLSITDAMCQLLRDQDTFNQISGLMRDHLISFTLDELRKGIQFLAMTQDALRKGMDEFKKTVCEVELLLSDNQASFVNSHRGSQVLGTLASSSNPVIINMGNKCIKLTGLVDNCCVLKGDILRLLEENAFLKRFLPLSTGRTKAVLTLFKERIDKTLQEYKDSQVSVTTSKDRCSIEVTGYGKAVDDVVNQLKESSKRIFKEELVFQRPGISKVIALESSRHMIDGLEKGKKVVIIRKDEDIEGSEPRDELEEYDIIPDLNSSKLICSYLNGSGLQLLVFQGDITKHMVDAIVNPANKQLMLGGGVAGMIKYAGGSVIQDECDRIVRERGSLMEGDVAITGAGKLPCRIIIHAVGPQWPSNTREIGEQELHQNQKFSKETLANLMASLLIEAEKEGCRAVAVPAISSGIFGFPKYLCANILVRTALDISKNRCFHNLKEVHFINNDRETVQIFNAEFISSFGMKKEFQSASGVLFSKKDRDGPVRAKPKSNKTRKVPNQQNSVAAKPGPNSTDSIAQAGNGIQLELINGDLAKVAADIIVNSASQDLNLSKNPCANGLSKAAGKTLQEECSAWIASHGQVPLYTFAETNGGKLQCKKVLHAVCGQYNGNDSENGLETLVTKILEKADKERSSTVAMPALGTGILKFPRDTVAEIMVDCVQKFKKTSSIRKVFLVAFHLDAPMIAAFKKALEKIVAGARKNSIRKAPKRSPLDEEDMVYKLGNVELEIRCGDITKESTDAIAVLGNENIQLNGAVGTAIRHAEGAEFSERIRSKRPQKEGSTMLLKTKQLPSRYIAHIFPKSESYDDLEAATKELFRSCDSKGLSSVSLPAIGTGVIGKTPEESAKLILQSFVDLSIDEKVPNIKKLNIVLFEERLVSSFKKTIKEILLNPEEAWGKGKENKGLLAWFKEKVDVVKSFWEGSSDKDRSVEHINNVKALPSANALSSVTLNLYFASGKRVVKEIRDKITKLLEDHITSTEVTKEMYKTAPFHDIDKIRSFAVKHGVVVELDKKEGKLKLSGYHRDIAAVTDHCYTMAEQYAVEGQKREKEQTIAKYVQWKEKQNDGSICDYDPVLNYQIETYFSNRETGARVEIDEGDDINTFELDFSDEENMKIKNIKTGEETVMIREELGNAETKEDLPSTWNPMPKDGSGLEKKFHCVQLQATSREFQDVCHKFCSSSGGQIHSRNVVQIFRIQNPQLYKSYLAKKESMQKTAGKSSVNELQLFHGTSPYSVVEINENGFNRSFAGVNGTAYGVGVYFATDSNYSCRYASTAVGMPRCMYLAKVLAGKYTGGSPGYKVAPKGFDTVVDNLGSPRIHVVFYDNQCYPEYLLHFN